MNTTITLPFQIISAVALFTAKEDVRYYINGVLVEICESGTDVRIVGTNGHVLAVRAVTLPESAAPEKLIIGNEEVKQIEGLVKAHYSVKRRAEAPVVIEYSAAKTDMRATVEVAGSALTVRLVDGIYPDWRKVLPNNYKSDGEAAQFDSRYLDLFSKAAKLLEGSTVGLNYHVHHNGDTTAVVEIPADSEFLGLIMPVRSKRGYTDANLLLNQFRK